MLEKIFKNLLIAQILLLILIGVKVMFEFTLLNEELYLISNNLPLPIPDIFAGTLFVIIVIAFSQLYICFLILKKLEEIFFYF